VVALLGRRPQPTALKIFRQLCACAAANTCLGLLLNRWFWYPARAAVRGSVDATLHQGERPEAAERNNTCREEWHEHLPYLRRGGWRKPY
jgi:hypothetical protein